MTTAQPIQRVVPEWVAALPEAVCEQDYFTLWQTHCAVVKDHHLLALYGGFCADRLPWVFIAGYQAAIRRTFFRHTFTDWCAFAVSEDRSDTPLPGVKSVPDGKGWEFNGYKSWIASSRFVSNMVVKAGSGKQAQYGFIAVDQPGVQLTHKVSPGMLPLLSQGHLHLNHVKLAAADILHDSNVADFGGMEKLYILTAFLGYLMRLSVQAGQAGDARHLQQSDAELPSLVDQARALHDMDHPHQDAMFADFSAAVQQLRLQLGKSLFAGDEDWQRDQKLIAMYR